MHNIERVRQGVVITPLRSKIDQREAGRKVDRPNKVVPVRGLRPTGVPLLGSKAGRYFGALIDTGMFPPNAFPPRR